MFPSLFPIMLLLLFIFPNRCLQLFCPLLDLFVALIHNNKLVKHCFSFSYTPSFLFVYFTPFPFMPTFARRSFFITHQYARNICRISALLSVFFGQKRSRKESTATQINKYRQHNKRTQTRKIKTRRRQTTDTHTITLRWITQIHGPNSHTDTKVTDRPTVCLSVRWTLWQIWFGCPSRRMDEWLDWRMNGWLRLTGGRADGRMAARWTITRTLHNFQFT